MKNYFLRLEEPYPEFGARAIEWAIFAGLLKLSYQFEEDERRIGLMYDVIIESYKLACQESAHGLEKNAA